MFGKTVSSLALSTMLLGLSVPVAAQVTGSAGNVGSPQGVPVTDITFEPADAPHTVCPAFGACPPGDQVTTEYLGFGVDFTQFDANPPVGVFSDPPDKFGGVNAMGDLDLLTPTCGRIVVPGTIDQGVTDFIGVAAGLVGGPSDILLEAFDMNGVLIASSFADDGTDADGDVIAEIPDPTGSIASFCVSTPTADEHGVHFVYLNNPTAALPPTQSVPTLSGVTALLLALMLAVVAALRFRRSAIRND